MFSELKLNIKKRLSGFLNLLLTTNLSSYCEIIITSSQALTISAFFLLYDKTLPKLTNVANNNGLVILYLGFLLTQLIFIKLKSLNKPLELAIKILNSENPGGIKVGNLNNFLDKYESRLGAHSQIYIVTNLLGEFDSQDYTIEVISNNIFNNCVYTYYLSTEVGDSEISDFIKQIKEHLTQKHNIVEAEQKISNLKFKTYYDNIVVCNLAYMRNTQKIDDRKTYGFWYSINCDDKSEAAYIEMRNDRLKTLKKIFKSIEIRSWSYK